MYMLLYYSDVSFKSVIKPLNGFNNIKDMCKMTVGREGVRVYEAHEVNQRVALVRVPFYFINLWMIPDRQSL